MTARQYVVTVDTDAVEALLCDRGYSCREDVYDAIEESLGLTMGIHSVERLVPHPENVHAKYAEAIAVLTRLSSVIGVELREAMLAAQGKRPAPEPIEPSAEDVVEYPEHPSVIDAQEEAARKHREDDRDAMIGEISAILKTVPAYRAGRVLEVLRGGGSI